MKFDDIGKTTKTEQLSGFQIAFEQTKQQILKQNEIKKAKEEQEQEHQENERIKNTHSFEINKYMQKDINPINMDHMQQFKRAEFNDPGQSESRATMETTLIKNLIVSYFDTVRKTMNDMVPKTIMAFLVNKAKN